MSSHPSPFPQPVVSAEGVPKTELAAAHTRSVNPWADIATVDADLARVTGPTVCPAARSALAKTPPISPTPKRTTVDGVLVIGRG